MLVPTIKGEIEEGLLEKREGVLDNENEHTTWTEWWLDGELVRRDAHVTLKTALFAVGEAARLGGE